MEFKTKIAILTAFYFIGFCVILSVLLYKNTKTNKNDKIKHVLPDLVQKKDEIFEKKTKDSLIREVKKNKGDGAETGKTIHDISGTDDDRQDEILSDDLTNQKLQPQDHQNQFNNPRQFTINQRTQENDNQNNQQPKTGNSTIIKCEVCDIIITKPGEIFCDQCLILFEQKKLEIRSRQGKKGQGGTVNPFLKTPEVLRMNKSTGNNQNYVNTTALSLNYSQDHLMDKDIRSTVTSVDQGIESSDIVKEEKILEQDVKNKTVAKDKCEFIILAKKPDFKKDFLIDSSNNKTLGIFTATKLKDEEKELDELFILSEINVVPEDKTIEFTKNPVFKISRGDNYDYLEKLEIYPFNFDYYKIEEAKMESFKKPFSDFIEYMKINFFKKSNYSVKNGIKVENKQFIMENVLISKGKSDSALLFKIDDKLYTINKLVKKYFEKYLFPPEIAENTTNDILKFFALGIDYALLPIKNQFDIKFNYLKFKIGDELNDLIRNFLGLFYDETLCDNVGFNCKIEIEQS